MRSALRLGSIFGIVILVHFTWLLIFALVTFSLVAYFAEPFPQLSPAAQISIGVTASLVYGFGGGGGKRGGEAGSGGGGGCGRTTIFCAAA